MPTLDRDRFRQHLENVLAGYRCAICGNDNFGVGPLVASARSVDTPQDLDPGWQAWQVPVTCDRCLYVHYFAVTDEMIDWG